MVRGKGQSRMIRSVAAFAALAVGLVGPGTAGPAAAAPAAAEDASRAKPDKLQRLLFEFRCFYEIPEWKGRAEEQFVEKMKAQVAAHKAAGSKELPQVADLYADCLMRRIEEFQKAGNLPDARERMQRLNDLDVKTDKIDGYKAGTGEILAQMDLDDAKRLIKDEPDRAVALFRDVIKNSRKEPAKEAMDHLLAEGKRRARFDERLAGGDKEEEIKAIDELLEWLGPAPAGAVPAVSAAIEALKERRSAADRSLVKVTFEVKPLAFDGPGQAVDLASAEATLTPSAGGGAPLKKPRLDKNFYPPPGTYDITVSIPGVADHPVATWLSRALVPGTPTVLALPSKIPAGMVHVGGWTEGTKKRGGFLIDRTEVLASDLRKFAQDLGSRDPDTKNLVGNLEELKDPGHPGWGVSEAIARKYAASVKKQVPTFQQWMDAAYGPGASARPFPWGREKPVPGQHCEMASAANMPSPVGTRSARGRSPYGPMDMAGNLAEWVVQPIQGTPHFWVIGGTYSNILPDPKPGKKDVLHDPMPGPDAFKALPAAEAQAYAAEKFFYALEKDAPYFEVGLRLVVTVE